MAYFEIPKIKNSEIQNWFISYLLFIKTEIRQVNDPFYLILHILCSIIFFVRWLKKLSTGKGIGKWGTILISSWKCNYQYLLDIQVYYLDIQAISLLVCILLNDNLFFMCNYTFFYNTCLYKPLSWKLTFPVTSKPTPLTVFNLQASYWIHCEEGTCAHAELSRITSKLVFFCLQIFKVYFAKVTSEF